MTHMQYMRLSVLCNFATLFLFSNDFHLLVYKRKNYTALSVMKKAIYKKQDSHANAFPWCINSDILIMRVCVTGSTIN